MINKTEAVSITTTPNIPLSHPVKKQETEELPQDTFQTSRDLHRKASIEHYPLRKEKEAKEKAKLEPNPVTLPKSPPSRSNPPKCLVIEPETPDIKDFKDFPPSGKISLNIFSRPEGVDVSDFEQNLQKSLGKLCHIQNPHDVESLQGKIPSLSELTQIHQSLGKNPDIPYDYLPDGCYARGHIAAKEMLDKGFNCGKIYVILGDNGTLFNPHRLRCNNKFTEGEWWYHVAPIVFAKDDQTGKTEGYVIDPAMDKNKPLKAEDWIRGCWTGGFKINVDTTHADTYDPPLENLSHPVPQEFSREEFDKYTPEALKTNKEYKQVLHKIKEKYYAQHPDESAQDGWTG